MKSVVAVAVMVAGLAAGAGPAVAEHNGPPRSSVDLDVDLKLGVDTFRLGGRLFGREGVWGAWINGQRRPDGFSLDGRLQNPERGFNFKFNADIDEWLRLFLPAPPGNTI